MIITILIILFTIIASVESISYGIYEVYINKNKIRRNDFNYIFYYWIIFTYNFIFF